MKVSEIALIIKDKPIMDSKPVLIAIEGFGGSGKTTIANQLCEELGAAYVVNIDDFIIKEKMLEPSWDNGPFDRKRLERQVLIPATTGQVIQYNKLLWETNTLSEPKIVPPVDYLIVEGITSYHPAIAHYYDFKIWIDTPIEVAKSRGIIRSQGNENSDQWNLWAQNDIDYQEKYHSEEVADFVVENDV